MLYRQNDNMNVNEEGPAEPGSRLRDLLLESVVDNLLRCAHRLGIAAEQLHHGGAGSAARRAVLRTLDHGGPQTVPDIARDRSVSRQHIQTVVNGLLEDALVERIPNPAHRRSRLVRLTLAGERESRSMAQREAALLCALDLGVDETELEAARRVLARLRQRLDDVVAHGSDT
jgi:DNA-binding MarR family transcriptional regulator